MRLQSLQSNQTLNSNYLNALGFIGCLINYLLFKRESGIIGHHKLPENFDPPSDYMQPNNNLLVITNNKETELIKKLNLEDLFSGKMNKQEQCLAEPSRKMSFIDRLDELLQNKYIWSLFTVFIASLFPLSKTIYDYRKKVSYFKWFYTLQLVSIARALFKIILNSLGFK